MVLGESFIRLMPGCVPIVAVCLPSTHVFLPHLIDRLLPHPPQSSCLPVSYSAIPIPQVCLSVYCVTAICDVTSADGMIYWAPAPIETNRVTNENSQRNLLQPKLEQVTGPAISQSAAPARLYQSISCVGPSLSANQLRRPVSISQSAATARLY